MHLAAYFLTNDLREDMARGPQGPHQYAGQVLAKLRGLLAFAVQQGWPLGTVPPSSVPVPSPSSPDSTSVKPALDTHRDAA